MEDQIETDWVPIWKHPFFVAHKLSDFVAKSGIPDLPLGCKSMLEYMVERRKRCEELGVRLSQTWVTKTVYF